jgi:hypothetical protein
MSADFENKNWCCARGAEPRDYFPKCRSRARYHAGDIDRADMKPAVVYAPSRLGSGEEPQAVSCA